MAGQQLERIQDAVKDFNTDAAARRAFAATVANGFISGRPMGPSTAAVVEAVLGRTMAVADAVTAITVETGEDVFGPELGTRPTDASPQGREPR